MKKKSKTSVNFDEEFDNGKIIIDFSQGRLQSGQVLSYMLSSKILENPHNVRFKALLAICIKYFGEPRVTGSHHIFKMPWAGQPRINLQRDGKMAKPYQVKQVLEAIQKWESLKI